MYLYNTKNLTVQSADNLYLRAGSGDSIGIADNSSGQTVNIGNTTGATALNLLAGTGNFTLNGAASTNYTVGDAATTGTITIGGTAQTGTISIGTGTGAQALNFGTGGTGAKTVTIGSTASTSSTVIQAGSGNVQIAGTLTGSTGNLQVTGSQQGNTVVDNRTVTTTQTITESTQALGYYLTNSTGTTASVTPTVTFNITGVPNAEGAFVYIHSEAIKGASSPASTSTVIVQINGTQISTVTTGSSTSAVTTKESYIAMYINGAWRLTAGTTSSDTADFAEWIPYTGDKPQPGDVLVTGDSAVSAKRSSSPYQSSILGVVSTAPYDTAGQDDGHSVIIALTGRVPVNVNLENGPIEKGDMLTSSSVPGQAMKATRGGVIIGTALEDYDGTQDVAQVVTQVHTGYALPENENQIQGDMNVNGNLMVSGGLNVGTDLNVGGVATLGSLHVTGDATIGGTLTVATIKVGNIEIDGHIITKGAVPTSQVMAAAGSAAAVNVDGNDTAGTITITTGTTGISAGDLTKINFSKIFGKTPKVLLTGQDDNSVNAKVYPKGKSTNEFMISTGQTLTPNTTYTFDYFIVE